MPGVVVGVDGSANGRSALEWAVGEAARRAAALTVLTVHEISHSFLTGRPVVLAADENELADAQTAATELTDTAISALGGATPASVVVRAVNGFAAGELIEATNDADLLVLGARGGAQAGGLAAHSPIGSVSSKVLHHAKCPVVVVPASGG